MSVGEGAVGFRGSRGWGGSADLPAPSPTHTPSGSSGAAVRAPCPPTRLHAFQLVASCDYGILAPNPGGGTRGEARAAKGTGGGVGEGSRGSILGPCGPGNLEARNKSKKGWVPSARGLGVRLGALWAAWEVTQREQPRPGGGTWAWSRSLRPAIFQLRCSLPRQAGGALCPAQGAARAGREGAWPSQSPQTPREAAGPWPFLQAAPSERSARGGTAASAR